MKYISGLEIRKSTIPNAGKGLFAYRKFVRGQRVTKYSGTTSTTRPNNQIEYILQINKNLFLDAKSLENYPGRYINDPHGTNKRVNVKFTAGSRAYVDRLTGVKYVSIISARNINPGSELRVLITYGKNIGRTSCALIWFISVE